MAQREHNTIATALQDDVLEREIRIVARPETVFAFFTDSAKMMLWMGKDVLLDPRPGGIFRNDIDGHHIARGEYVEVVPYSRVVFTWGWEKGATHRRAHPPSRSRSRPMAMGRSCMCDTWAC